LPKQPQSFRCVHCHEEVSTSAVGTQHRNHCPLCLWSRHVDEEPGDRASDCLGSMEPIAITVRGDGEWVLIHQCKRCGELHSTAAQVTTTAVAASDCGQATGHAPPPLELSQI
jgi:hypothetical protein